MEQTQNDDWRVTVTMEVRKGTFGEHGEHLAKEFHLAAPLDVLHVIDITGSVSELYNVILYAIRQREGETE